MKRSLGVGHETLHVAGHDSKASLTHSGLNFGRGHRTKFAFHSGHQPVCIALTAWKLFSGSSRSEVNRADLSHHALSRNGTSAPRISIRSTR